MNNTEKLCNFRDCTNGQHEPCPHNAVDPCKVFRHAESGHWYDELTGQPIRHFRLEDGTLFDVQMWLEEKIVKAATSWKFGNVVHEEYRSHVLTTRPSKPGAKAPAYSNEELDAIANNFIRNNDERVELQDDLKQSGLELHGLRRMQKKWGSHPMLAVRIRELEEHRDALRVVQSDMKKDSRVARTHLKSDNEWTDKWRPTTGKWDEFVLMCDYGEKLLVIDRNGLKSGGMYVYIPSEDQKFVECAVWAEKQYGIPTSRWEKMGIPRERIGTPMRRYGKKNANGRRIHARADQIKYAGSVQDTIKALRQMHVSVLKMASDDELYKYYLENVKPK